MNCSVLVMRIHSGIVNTILPTMDKGVVVPPPSFVCVSFCNIYFLA